MITCPNITRNVVTRTHNYWTIHLKLYDTRTNQEDKKEEKKVAGIEGEQRRVLTSGKVVGFKQNKQEWMVRTTNKYKRDKYRHIEG